MKLPRVYIETTVPSYYYEIREDVESIAKKLITNDWWNNHRYYYELVTGPPVLDELERGDHPSKVETINLIKDLPILTIVSQFLNLKMGNQTSMRVPTCRDTQPCVPTKSHRYLISQKSAKL